MSDDVRSPLGLGSLARSVARAHALPCAIILLVGVVLFGRVLFFDFVHYDDYPLLVENYGSIVHWPSAVAAFWRDTFAVLGPEAKGVFYRPLLVATYTVEAQIAGTEPFVYHLTNVVLHLLASCFAYAFLVTFGAGRWLALSLALVFCCHPSAALVAAWIPCRNDSLLAIWSVASTLMLVAFLRSGRRSALALSLVCLAGALFTKESGVMLLPALVCVAALEGKRRPWDRRGLLWASAGVLVIVGSWAALRHAALGASPVGASRALENLPVLVAYLGKTFFPVGLAVVPHPEDTSLVPGFAALAMLGLAIALTGRRLLGVAGLGLVWYAAFLLPVLLVARQTWGLEHRIYVPLLGMLLFVAHLQPPARMRLPARWAPVLALGVALAFGVATARRLPDFAGPLVYWESAVRTAPHSEQAISNLAWHQYKTARRFDAAFGAVERALALDPEQAEMVLLRGILLAHRGEFERAEAEFRRVLELDPENANAWGNLALLQRRMDRLEEARRSQRRADELRQHRSAR